MSTFADREERILLIAELELALRFGNIDCRYYQLKSSG